MLKHFSLIALWLFCTAGLAAEKRVALVIGNSSYKNAPLVNPVNDARAISKSLSALGFKVILLENQSRKGMREGMRKFGGELSKDAVGLFYYAGHGMQIKGKNYLVPVDALLEHEDDIDDEAIDANFVLQKMDDSKNRLNLVILDACRNNPFARSFRSAQSGLAQMDAPTGSLIAFATAPGSVASDGEGGNGLYTQHLLKAIETPNVPVEQVFKKVRQGVAKDSKERQIPWESSSLTGDFYFKGGAVAVASNPADRQAEIDAAVAAALRKELERLRQSGAFAATEPGKTARPAPAASAKTSANSPARTKNTSMRSLWPLAPGQQWTFQRTDGYSGKPLNTYTLRVVDADEKKTIITNGKQDIEFDQQMRIIRQPSSGKIRRYEPGYQLFKFPFAKGERWQQEISVADDDGTQQVYQLTYEVMGEENIAVPAGKFKTIRVDHEMAFTGQSAKGHFSGVVNYSTWFSPELGYWVKQELKRRYFNNNGKPDLETTELIAYKR